MAPLDYRKWLGMKVRDENIFDEVDSGEVRSKPATIYVIIRSLLIALACVAAALVHYQLFIIAMFFFVMSIMNKDRSRRDDDDEGTFY